MNKSIIPGILTDSAEDFSSKIKLANEFADRVCIDVIDGLFADNLTVMPDDMRDLNWGDLKIDMQLIIKALIGAVVVVIIQLLTHSKNYYLAGLVPLFPTFALISHYLVGNQRTTVELKMTIIFSMFSLIPYFIYLLALYLLVERIRLEFALLMAALCWGVAASLLIFLWNRFFL